MTALADSLASVAPVHARPRVDDRCPVPGDARRRCGAGPSAGALAVEMQAASLFAFAQTRDAAIGVVAMVSNSGDHTGEQFDTGEHAYRVAVLDGIIAGAARFIRARRYPDIPPHRYDKRNAEAHMERAAHWNRVYTTKTEQDVSWFEPLPALSLEMLEAAGMTADSLRARRRRRGLASRRCAGGTRPRLPGRARRLWRRARPGEDSPRAGGADARFGSKPMSRATWSLKPMDIWHDRAVFHFLTAPEERARYKQHLLRDAEAGRHCHHRDVRAGWAGEVQRTAGAAVLARDRLAEELGSAFELRDARAHVHTTPWGSTQSFQYSRLLRAH